ncbi:VOC family protein [Mycobacterium sp. IDR2000157661]|uniref:VOC family protein n=1 Tax=Mycobacterium sp. IDR2000157661 TaxID=2867005 RepID=UPI001EEA5922|nr:VOC family protein [Mycobacterium sp. IDR2000157661]ULE32456.1 VOC family protein [Mycobacterium sp. IDR2000157661]
MHAQTPVQIAWVTRDLDATEKVLSALLGAKRWVRMPDVHFAPDACTFRGEPADFVATISLSYAGETQLELIAPMSGASLYSEFLEACGPGLHHICVEKSDVEAFDAALVDVENAGMSVVAQGQMPGGMRFAYVAAPAAGVPYVEIAYIPDEIKAFFEYVKQEQT